jgi:CheY-like chemotaxis protein
MTRAGTIFIVDDDEECRTTLREVLEDEGCVVYTAENGKVALQMLGAVRPDLLIVDLMMPVMNGWELCTELGKDPRLADIPVAILSAVAHRRPPACRHVLEKPVGLSTVLALLDAVGAARSTPPAPSLS